MGLLGMGSKLALHLGLGSASRHPHLEAVASHAQPQHGSVFMQLPPEIKDVIFQELWHDAGIFQHVMLRWGRIVGMRCVTTTEGPDELLEECASHGITLARDLILWRRFLSPWGNHWKCEERYQSRSKTTEWSPYLAMMLTCRQLYVESRTSIYSTVTFVMHDLNTLCTFVVSQPSLMINNIKHLQITIRLPLISDRNKKLSNRARAAMARWRECCQALDRAENLASVDLWLDTVEPGPRFVLSSVLNADSNPYIFGERLASILTVDLPVNPDKPEVWDTVANVEPRFAIRPRGWPAYLADIDDRKCSRIIKQWDWAEPGVSASPPARHIVHPSQGFFSQLTRLVF
ncbi:Fc.00g034120.m01.CDS01 [Cosmosporella sp. VM-42]